MLKGYPTVDPRAAPMRDLQTILIQESESLVLYSETTANVLTTTTSSSPANMGIALDNTTAGGASLGGIGAGRMFWIGSIMVGVLGLPSGTSVSIQVGGYGDAASKFPQFVCRVTYSAGAGMVTIPVNQFFRQIRTDRSGLAAQIRTVSPAVGSTTPVTFVMTVVGQELTDDLNFHAPKTLVVFGDSLNYGKGYGPSVTADLYAFKMRDRFKSDGNDIRILSYAQPGRTSAMIEADRASGKFDAVEPSMGVYALGTNDAVLAAGGYVATAQANLLAFWSWYNGKWPTKPLLIVPPGPMNNTTYMSNAAALISGLQSTVATINSPLCKLVDISAAFTSTDTSKYRPSDEVHWNTSGHSSVYSAIDTFLGSNPSMYPA